MADKEMKRWEIEKIHDRMQKMPHAKYMMATEAYHLLGNISSDHPDICVVGYQTDDYWIGSWITGHDGFVRVVYPKATTRELTPEEKKEYHEKVFVNPDGSKFQLDVK